MSYCVKCGHELIEKENGIKYPENLIDVGIE